MSKKHLPRYLGEFDFRWNTRKMNDGDRTIAGDSKRIGQAADYATMQTNLESLAKSVVILPKQGDEQFCADGKGLGLHGQRFLDMERSQTLLPTSHAGGWQSLSWQRHWVFQQTLSDMTGIRLISRRQRD